MKIAVYMRFARDPDKEMNEQSQQELRLREYAIQQGLNIQAMVTEYVSAKDTPPMLDMLLRAPSEEIEGILALKSSAFSRDTPGFINCLSKADRAGKKLLLVESPEHIDLANRLRQNFSLQ